MLSYLLPSQTIKDYQLSSEQYISGPDGKVYMNVSFWGAGGNSGTIQVYEGIDFASLMSAVGGPTEYANLKKLDCTEKSLIKMAN